MAIPDQKSSSEMTVSGMENISKSMNLHRVLVNYY